MTAAELRAALAAFETLPFVPVPTLVEPMPRLAARLGTASKNLLIKRDDAIAFGFGGNKVRKLAFVAAHAKAQGADTLITAGGVQSNHARATASAAAKLGMRAILVANGQAPALPAGNALLDALLGAEMVYVSTRDERTPLMNRIADRLRAEGRQPYVIPIGASTPLGALGYVHAVAELVDQIEAPDVIVHSTSSGGTQAGIVAGCRLLGLQTRVIGVSADERAHVLHADVEAIVRGISELLEVRLPASARPLASVGEATPKRAPMSSAREGGKPDPTYYINVDDRFVGEGYGVPTVASREAIELAARTEAIFLDPTYTAKAMAGLIAYVRDHTFDDDQTVLFWHTGGQVGLFA
jgi:1-aminocyclopropane-1-carboxylate deaminase/D-cysteine desulfhydrase-like pyridoxal-dependent ACC family enzyme